MEIENNNINDGEMGFEPRLDSNQPELGKIIGSALAYFFSMLAFILFVCPFAFWKGAAYRLYKECKAKSLKTMVSTSRWPFFTFLKKIFFEFLIDGMMFIFYFIGVIIAFIVLFTDGGFGGFIITLIATYYSPMALSWVRDFFVLLLLPFQKFLSWVSKPAQQIDVDFHNKD